MFVLGLLFCGLVLSSCGSDEASSSSSNESSKVSEEKKVKMRTCDCCGKDFPKKKGWSNMQYVGVKKTSNGNNCSKRCAMECGPR